MTVDLPVVLNPEGQVRTVPLKEALFLKMFPECRGRSHPLTKKDKKRLYDQQRYQRVRQERINPEKGVCR